MTIWDLVVSKGSGNLSYSPQPSLLESNLRAQPELGKGWAGVFEEGPLPSTQNQA